MRLLSCLLFILVSAFPSVCFGRSKSKMPIRVLIGNHRENAIGVHTIGSTWRLRVHRAANRAAVVHDVTTGYFGKWIIPVMAGQLVFDQTRFVSGHAYRVTLGSKSLVVYLYPPKIVRQQRFDFSEPDSSQKLAEGEIAIMPKGAL